MSRWERCRVAALLGEVSMLGQTDNGTLRRCEDCGQASPRTQTSYTLIGSGHGWRLVRRVDQAGDIVLEWRCPSCWKKYKAQQQTK